MQDIRDADDWLAVETKWFFSRVRSVLALEVAWPDDPDKPIPYRIVHKLDLSQVHQCAACAALYANEWEAWERAPK